MNAIELANKYYTTGVMSAVEAAAMLRRQHEAIVKLREALAACSELVGAGLFEKYCGQALQETSEFSK